MPNQPLSSTAVAAEALSVVPSWADFLAFVSSGRGHEDDPQHRVICRIIPEAAMDFRLFGGRGEKRHWRCVNGPAPHRHESDETVIACASAEWCTSVEWIGVRGASYRWHTLTRAMGQMVGRHQHGGDVGSTPSGSPNAADEARR